LVHCGSDGNGDKTISQITLGNILGDKNHLGPG
jgi:hypothetical protein